MNCPRCSTPHSAAARFCGRCGSPLHEQLDRADHYAAHPDEPVRALALLSTLLPHLTGRRHHHYRYAMVLALLASLVCAGFGVLSVALICAALVMPAIVLAYLHDFGVWRDEPALVVGAGFAVTLVLGGLLGELERNWAAPNVLRIASSALPPASEILEVGVVVPLLVLIAVCLAPLAVTSRAAFGHPIDAVNVSALSGAAASLGLSVVLQQGAFSHAMVGNTDPASTAFIALTLGFAQPVLFATAAALVVQRLRRVGGGVLIGAAEGAALLIVNGLATTLLASYGARGIVLTALVTAALAAVGLLLVRAELHTGLLAEAEQALDADAPGRRVAGDGQICAHCGAHFVGGSSFCQVCGTAAAAQQPHAGAAQPRPATTLAPSAA